MKQMEQLTIGLQQVLFTDVEAVVMKKLAQGWDEGPPACRLLSPILFLLCFDCFVFHAPEAPLLLRILIHSLDAQLGPCA